MGDFSRDSFRATNVLNEILGWAEEPVEDARHYVGVRIQQGVPVLDADINELEDVRRAEQEAAARFFIGDGVPMGSDGFRVFAAEDDNDFSIEAGLALVGGALAWNPARTSYRTQPNHDGQRRTPRPDLPALEPLAPPDDEVRHDLVVLDVWEREVDYTEDERLVDERVGMETGVRWEREWVVRVRPGVDGDAQDVPEAMHDALRGHRLYAIARIRRRPGADAIEADDITDLRRTDLTLARGEGLLRVYGEDGALEYDVRGFGAICESGLDIYDDLLHSDLFLGLMLADPNPAESIVILDSFQDVGAEWRMGREAARHRRLGNRGAMELLGDLLAAQRRFHDRLRPMAEGVGGALERFFDGFQSRLGMGPDDDAGLAPAVEEGSLRKAIEAQIELNHYIAARTGALPIGSIRIVYEEPPTDDEIVAPGTYRFGYALTGELSVGDTLDLTARVDGAPEWSADLEEEELTLEPGETRRVDVELTIPPDTTSSEGRMVLRARSRVNPGGIDDRHDDAVVRLNEPPPIAVPITIVGSLPVPLPVGPDEVPAGFMITNEEEIERDYTVTFTLSDDGIEVNPESSSTTISGGSQRFVPVGLSATDEATDGTEVTLTVVVHRQDTPSVRVEREFALVVDEDA